MRYLEATGIFPIMHVIAMRRAVFARYPWVAMNLLKAFEEAKERSLERIQRSDGLAHPDAVVGIDRRRMAPRVRRRPVSLGLEATARRSMRICRFAHEQGVTARRLTPDDLFPKEVRASVRV